MFLKGRSKEFWFNSVHVNSIPANGTSRTTLLCHLAFEVKRETSEGGGEGGGKGGCVVLRTVLLTYL